MFGLLGLLLTLAILGLLGARVLSSVDEPAAPAATMAPGAGTSATVRCELARTTLTSALEAYRVRNGSPAPDQQALVADGLLAEPVDLFVYDPTAPEPLRPTGDCDG